MPPLPDLLQLAQYGYGIGSAGISLKRILSTVFNLYLCRLYPTIPNGLVSCNGPRFEKAAITPNASTGP